MSALVEGLPGGVLVLDSGGEIEEAIRRRVGSWANRCAASAFAAVLARAAVNSGAIGEHTDCAAADSSISRAAKPASGGEVVLLTDVTETHLMQVFLSRQQRLLTLGELAAGLAHQIRTPLAAALLYASQMSMPGRSPQDLARCGERTVESLKQLDKLVNDMLAFAHGGAARESVNVSALLEQVAQWLRPALRRGVRLTIRTQAPDLKVRANAPSLVSAVLNLATNALQAATADLDLELLGRRAAQRPRANRRER